MEADFFLSKDILLLAFAKLNFFCTASYDVYDSFQIKKYFVSMFLQPLN